MDKVVTDEAKIDELLSRGVEDIFVKEEFKKDLLSGRQLRIKLGIDPTGPKIHLGRAIPLRKLRELQKMGHQVVLIVGDFTAQVGDASDKSDKRPMLTRAQIDDNLKDYKSQISKIIDISKTEFVYNFITVFLPNIIKDIKNKVWGLDTLITFTYKINLFNYS